MTKHDNNKHRPTLVLKSMARAIEAVIEVGEHGARKYADDNWLTVPDGVTRYTNAMLRHQQAEFMGEIVDRDSGLQHAAHAAWNALARLELMLRAAEMPTWQSATAAATEKSEALRVKIADDSQRKTFRQTRSHAFGPLSSERVAEKSRIWGRAYGDAYALTPEEISELVGRIATRLRRP